MLASTSQPCGASTSGAATLLGKRERRASPPGARKAAKLRPAAAASASEPATPAFPAGDAVLRPCRRRQPVQSLQLRDRIVQCVRQWASQLDDDQLTGPDALDLCCGLFRRFQFSRLPAQAALSTPEDAPWESLLKNLNAQRKLELAACLWLGLKLTETQTVTPDAKQMAWVTGHSALAIRRAEVEVCNALEWALLAGTSAVSPALDVPSRW